MTLRFFFTIMLIGLAGCAAIPIDRTTSSAWYYERYDPSIDKTVSVDSGTARVLVFQGVHFAVPIHNDQGKEVGQADGWRTEIEVFFPRDQLPEVALDTAIIAVKTVCENFDKYTATEEHPHYIRMAADC